MEAALDYASAWEGDNDEESCAIYNAAKAYREAEQAEVRAWAKIAQKIVANEAKE